jgi:hypothetical protein
MRMPRGTEGEAQRKSAKTQRRKGALADPDRPAVVHQVEAWQEQKPEAAFAARRLCVELWLCPG